MADTADRPHQGQAGEFTSAPLSAGTSQERDATRGFISLPSSESATESYRPISMTAIAGFALAVLYTLIIIVGGFIAYFAGDSFLLSYWTVLLPIAAGIICWAARRGILNSEGTLSGINLANWGMALSAVIGLSYWSYYAATFLAVRQQAAAFVERQYFPLLTKGKIEESYLLTLRPPRPANDAALRGLLETIHNTPQRDPGAPGPFTMYSESEGVRFLQMAGDKAEIRLVSAGSPVREKGGLQVLLLYHVNTPEASFDLSTLVSGIESRAKEQTSGRQWQVLSSTVQPETRVFSEHGKRLLLDAEQSARAFATIWAKKVEALDISAAYVDTLSPTLRATLTERLKGKSKAELDKLIKEDTDLRNYRAGLAAFAKGSVVRAEKGVFWAGESQREEIIADVKKCFHARNEIREWMKLANVLPCWEQNDKTIRFAFDTTLLLLPKYTVGARINVEADASILTADGVPNADVWRIVDLELIRARSVPPPKEKGAR